MYIFRKREGEEKLSLSYVFDWNLMLKLVSDALIQGFFWTYSEKCKSKPDLIMTKKCYEKNIHFEKLKVESSMIKKIRVLDF